MSNNDSSTSTGIGFPGLLTILFIALKLGVGSTSVVGWSWLWVLSPLWITFLVVFFILLIVALVTD